MIIAQFAAIVTIGYLLGSIPFGALIAKRQANLDVRQHGSGKMGTTNVLRTVGSKAAAGVATLDVTKGALAVLIAGLIIGDGYIVIGDFSLGRLIAQIMAALAAVAGHIKPLFFKFQGGRGVAPFFGGLAALCPPAAIFGGEMLFVSAGLTRHASLGSLAGVVSAYAILIPFTIINKWPIEYLLYTLTGAVLVIAMHRDNIARILSGKERKLGEKTNKRDSPPLT